MNSITQLYRWQNDWKSVCQTCGDIIDDTSTSETQCNKCQVKLVPIRVEDKPKRNKPCPCGSKLKFKKCCLHILRNNVNDWDVTKETAIKTN